MKSLREMIVAFTKLNVSRVTFLQRDNGKVLVTGVRKHPLTGRIVRRVSKEYPSIMLRALAEQIAVGSHGLYMTGWDAKVDFVNHTVSRVEFSRLGRISARAHSPERKYLQAANA